MDNLAMGEPGFPLTGGCGCGAVRFEVRAQLGPALYCHCTRCQRRTGTGASVTARVESASFKIASGGHSCVHGSRTAVGRSGSAAVADRRSTAATQSKRTVLASDSGLSTEILALAGLASVIAAGLLIIYVLDHPYQSHTGGIQPSAMRRTLVMMGNLEPSLRPSCSASGQPG